MEPVTWALMVGAGVVSAAGGYLAGRRGAAPEREALPAAVVSAPDPRLKELEGEVVALRELLALPAGQEGRLKGELLGADQGVLRAALAEVLTHKAVRAACVIDAQGLVVCGEDRDSGQAALAALVAGARGCGVDFWQMRWEDDRGSVLEVFQLVGGRRQAPLYLGVWSKGLELPRSAAGRARALCGGVVREVVGGAGSRLQLRDERGARGLRQIAEAAPLKRLRVQQGHAVLVDEQEGQPGFDDGALWRLWGWAHGFGRAREALGLGAQAHLVVTSAARRVAGLHAFASAQGGPCVLWLEQSSQESYPMAHIGSWVGQLAWQVPGMIMGLPEPAASAEPARLVKHPEAVRASR
jgi:hypothetical protein